MPMCHLRLHSSKPKSCAYPKELKTLGDHIRKRRLDLSLLQRDVAGKVGVEVSSVVNWEKGRATPELRYMPAILALLGYDPRSEPTSLPERLVAFRQGKGWAQ